MAKEVNLPQLGQTMEEGTIVSCLVKVGDEVKKGDVIFEIETDKATLEMESPADGFVKAIKAEAGQTLPVGSAVLILGAEDEEVAKEAATASAAVVEEPVAAASPAPTQTTEGLEAVKLPQLGQTMEEGTIVSCLVKIDDEVKKGDVIFEIETDKATLEMESPADGFVKHISAEAGQTLPVGEVVMVLGEKDQQISSDYINSLKTVASGQAVAPESAPAKAEVVSEPTPAEVKPAAVEPKSQGRIFASPRAIKTAKLAGVDLSTITGSGPGGRIVETDVASGKAASKVEAMPEPEYALGEKVPLSRMGKIIAEKMLQSKQQIPCFYLTVKVNVTKLVKLRAKLNKTGQVKIAYNDFILRAIGLGCKHYPIMTGQPAGDSIQLAENISVGLAISVEDGLVAPMVKDLDKKTPAQIAADSKALIAKARANKLSPSDLSGGCCTLSNLGAFGIEAFTPIVVPGQCSILGVGKITATCVPSGGNLLVRDMMNMTLSVDHRVVNGAYAAQFLDFAAKLLSEPERLL